MAYPGSSAQLATGPSHTQACLVQLPTRSLKYLDSAFVRNVSWFSPTIIFQDAELQEKNERILTILVDDKRIDEWNDITGQYMGKARHFKTFLQATKINEQLKAPKNTTHDRIRYIFSSLNISQYI